MEQTAIRSEASDRTASPSAPERSQPSLRAGASSIRLRTSDRSEQTTSHDKWPRLLERVQTVARHVRVVQERAHEQELHAQDLLEKARADTQAARAQALAAEHETRDVQARANRLIEVAEERARLAEERAAASDEILLRLQKLIEAEFAIRLDEPASLAVPLRETVFAMKSAS